jgi:hypothetical protein
VERAWAVAKWVGDARIVSKRTMRKEKKTYFRALGRCCTCFRSGTVEGGRGTRCHSCSRCLHVAGTLFGSRPEVVI